MKVISIRNDQLLRLLRPASPVRLATVIPAAPVPGLEPAFDVAATLGPLEDHGTTRVGHRRVVPIAGGRVTGLIDAEILPGGADWQVIRPDGTIEIDTRYSARTPDGEYVHFRTSGVRSGPPEVLDALLRGEPVNPSAYYFRRRGLPGDVRSAAGRPRAVDLRRVRRPGSRQRALHGISGHLTSR